METGDENSCMAQDLCQARLSVFDEIFSQRIRSQSKSSKRNKFRNFAHSSTEMRQVAVMRPFDHS
jgi:hypothetical protein